LDKRVEDSKHVAAAIESSIRSHCGGLDGDVPPSLCFGAIMAALQAPGASNVVEVSGRPSA
jgi:hypothetical protein